MTYSIRPSQKRADGLLDLPSESLAARFARAVAARTDRIFLVHPDNTGHWEPWPDAGMPASSYAVHLADARGFCTLALDFDGDGAAHEVEKAAALLRDAGVEYVLARSGPRSGWHILATFIDRIALAAMARLARVLRRRVPSLDDGKLRNPDTGAIRPPLSPHRLGGRSEPIGLSLIHI